MAVLDAAIDDIGADAKDVHVGRTLAKIAVAPFIAIGWIGGRVMSGAAWLGLSIRYGYRLGRPAKPSNPSE